MAARKRVPIFHPTEAVLIRATTYTPGPSLPNLAALDPASAAAGIAQLSWLREVWHDANTRYVLQVASPTLSQQIRQALTSTPDARRLRRLVRTVSAYLLRWQGRPTPLGLFAGVAPVTVGTVPAVRWAQRHRVCARADAQWLSTVIDRLERHPLLCQRLPVHANNTIFPRGSRLVIDGHCSNDLPTEQTPLEVSIRSTAPARHVLDLASVAVRFGDLAKQVTEDYPHIPTARITAALTELVAQQFLLTSLRAALTVPDALGHLVDELDAARAEDLLDVAEDVQQLRAVRDHLSRHNATPSPADAASIRDTATAVMRTMCEVTAQPLLIDVGLDGEFALPVSVLEEAANAASALLQLTPYPYGRPIWRDFHTRFRRRYGPGAVVAVRDLVADSGLGLPADYLGAATGGPPRILTGRDEALLALAQQACIDGNDEVVLTNATLGRLRVDDSDEALAPPRVELAFQIHATDLEDVRRGNFRILVTGAPRPASSMAGRFLHMTPDNARAAWASSYDEPDNGPFGTVAAQLSAPPRRRRDENVVRTPCLLTRLISLSEHRRPDGEMIGLADLAVTGDSRHLYLIQCSTGRPVEPRVLHALEAGNHTPPLVRFLAEISTARCASYQPFSWGAAGALPYLPRVRYGRTVLSPARWLLAAQDLPHARTPMSVWETALIAWRARWHTPLRIVLCEGELRLPLDLDHAAHRMLLRNRLDRARRVELREAPAIAALGWVGRPHEILVALRRTDTDLSARPKTTPAAIAIAPRARHLPGCSDVLQVQVHGHPGRQNEILTEYLPALLDGWEDSIRWWFRRHRDLVRPDTEQHLDIYIHLVDRDRCARTVAHVGAWAADLRHRNLIPGISLATYEPETGRYGHGQALDAAYDVFGADSAAAVAQLRHVAVTGTPIEALTAASIIDLAASYTNSADIAARWLIEHIPHDHVPACRILRDATLRVASLVTDGEPNAPSLIVEAVGAEVVARWQERATALQRYRGHLAAAHRDPETVLRSLLHGHQVRAVGVDPNQERLTHHLARAAALRHTARLAVAP